MIIDHMDYTVRITIIILFDFFQSQIPKSNHIHQPQISISNFFLSQISFSADFLGSSSKGGGYRHVAGSAAPSHQLSDATYYGEQRRQRPRSAHPSSNRGGGFYNTKYERYRFRFLLIVGIDFAGRSLIVENMVIYRGGLNGNRIRA